MSEALTNDMRTEANIALMELDKGLRSSKLGEQCEAIVKFPVLADRFPFPILVNAAFLKLADLFRNCPNLLRLNILQVLQSSEKHLNKITSVDEFLRCISSVIHSNDPVARAITLRVFGSIASIIAERKSVQHSIHRSLESNDLVEVEAAIFATSCLSRHSGAFAAGICDKIASMVLGLTSPVEMKLRLIPVLKQMHHDIGTATQVRELCLKLLPAYPSLSFVSAILSTLTELAIATLVHVPDQVRLLLGYARSDARCTVRQLALRELHAMADRVPHMWTEEMCEGVLSVAAMGVMEVERELGLFVLLCLSRSVAVHTMSSLKDRLLPHCYTLSCKTAAYAMGSVASIVMATAKEDLPTGTAASNGHAPRPEVEEVARMLSEALLVLDFDLKGSTTALKVLLASLTGLARHPGVGGAALEALMSVLPAFTGPQMCILSRGLVSIAANASGDHMTPKLLGYLEARGSDRHHETLLPIVTVLMQLQYSASSSSSSSLPKHSFLTSSLSPLLDHIAAMTHPRRFWVAYRVARRASMMGFHELAEPIYLQLSTLVTMAMYHNWLSALQQFSLAHTLLSSSSSSPSPSYSSSSSSTTPSSAVSIIPALCKAAALTSNASVRVKASSPPSSFPLHFLSAHTAFLNAHSQLLSTCVSVHTAPPPSIPGGFSSTEKRFQLCMSQFQTLAEQYSTLYSSLFDADPSTLEYIALLQQSCLLMASVISSVALSRKPLISPAKVMTPKMETPSISTVEVLDNFNTRYVLGRACKNVMDYAQNMAASLQSLPVGEEHAAALSECSGMILQAPTQLPPYFFIFLQQTNIKLVLSPPIPSSGQRISVNPNTHLTLKVEGVIEHSGKKQLYRSPQAAHLLVMPTLQKAFPSDMKQPELSPLSRTEPVVKDFFQATFLLALPTPGHYSVSVDASLVDHRGRVWHTGPRVSLELLVEGEEAAGSKQQQQQQPPQQQRAAVPQREMGGAQSSGAKAGPSLTHRV